MCVCVDGENGSLIKISVHCQTTFGTIGKYVVWMRSEPANRNRKKKKKNAYFDKDVDLWKRLYCTHEFTTVENNVMLAADDDVDDDDDVEIGNTHYIHETEFCRSYFFFSAWHFCCLFIHLGTWNDVKTGPYALCARWQRGAACNTDFSRATRTRRMQGGDHKMWVRHKQIFAVAFLADTLSGTQT